VELNISNLNKYFVIKNGKNGKISKKKRKEGEKNQILKNLNLTLNNQEIFCLLGNNGAGKSTLMNCIGGLLHPDSGEIIMRNRFESINILKESSKAKHRIIFCFQDPKFDSRLDVEKNLDFHLRMFLIERETRKKLIFEYLEKFNLQSKRKSKFYFLSGGQKKQVENIRGFITAQSKKSEEILFLTDEPTAYCDIVAKKLIWEEINQINSHSTILFSTNDLYEAEKLTNRENGKIGFIKQGSINFSGSLKELQSQLSTKGNISFSTSCELNNEIFFSFNEKIKKIFPILKIETQNEQCIINISNIGEEQMNTVLKSTVDYFSEKNIFLDKIENRKPTIDDLFRINGE
jgi:ABC-2 type transport system ATP-binding protein